MNEKKPTATELRKARYVEDVNAARRIPNDITATQRRVEALERYLGLRE